jgi:5-methylcytosine-specific restriction endonuclease McrA
VSGQWAGSTRRYELPPDWPELRALVLARDEHRCRWRENGTVCGRTATDVDHIRPGTDHSLTNLQALCRDHHAIKSSREGNAAPRVTRWRPTERHPGLL